MGPETASSFLNDPKIALLTCPHSKFERTPRVRAIEKALHDGACRVLYIRVPAWHSDKVPQFHRAFPTCAVRLVRENYGKYILLKLTPKEYNNGTTRPTTEPAPDDDGSGTAA